MRRRGPGKGRGGGGGGRGRGGADSRGFSPPSSDTACLKDAGSLQVRALTAEGKAMKDKTKNNSTGQLPKKERFQFKEAVEMK